MTMSRRSKVLLILLPFAALSLWLGWRGVLFLWYRGYSIGTRSGVIRKISIKGPPYCKYFSAEMVLQGSLPGMPFETWEFSVDDERPEAPLVKALQEAERRSDRVTVHYRQDRRSLFRCTPSEYFATALER